MSSFLAIAALLVVFYRIRPDLLSLHGSDPDFSTRAQNDFAANLETTSPLVSVILPVRNELENLDRFYAAYQQIEYPNKELIVIDDGSTDETTNWLATYLQSPDRYIKAPEKPDGWLGKSWACHHGSQIAGGELLLFTDADVEHTPLGLEDAVKKLIDEKLGLLTAPPFHRAPTLWEKVLGPFHLMVLAVTGAFVKPTIKLVYFSIGQYLLFKKSTYETIGGHRKVSGELAEDMALAREVLTRDLKFGVFPKPGLYKVRMFSSMKSFWEGWSRLQAIGFGYSRPLNTLLSIFMVTGLIHSAGFFQSELQLLLYFVVMVFFIKEQRRHGDFSLAGGIFFPLGVVVFIAVSLGGAYTRWWKKEITWRRRVYPLKDQEVAVSGKG